MGLIDDSPPRDEGLSDVNVYTDPDLYDTENQIVDELAVLLPLAAQAGGPIVDLACGTGRTTLPLAEAGFQVIGVDSSAPMLAAARRKAEARGLRVDFHLQDCRRLELPVQARMATMTGNSFQEFLTNDDQDALLRSVHRHLAPGCVFLFGTRLPSGANLDRPAGEQPWRTVIDADGRGIDVSVIWRYDPVTQVQDYTFIERIGDGTPLTEERRSVGRLRYTGPMEMRRLLAAHDFELRVIHGDWDGSLLSKDSLEMVVIAVRGNS